MNKKTTPIYDGKRNFLGMNDLVVSFYTQRCQFNCNFCNLRYKSPIDKVPSEDIKHQIDWTLDKYKNDLISFKQVSFGNEGSILDKQRFPTDAFDYLLQKTQSELPNLKIISLETRSEYVKEGRIKDILDKITKDKKLDFTIGFETQDDNIRNNILNKKLNKNIFEQKIEIMGRLGVRLTSYVMLKPSPSMTDQEGIEEALRTIRYLKDLCTEKNTELVIYLNPTYFAGNTPLATEMKQKKYHPPTIETILETILALEKEGVPIYTGLWEGNSESNREYYSDWVRYSINLRDTLKEFNKTQDFLELKKILSKQVLI